MKFLSSICFAASFSSFFLVGALAEEVPSDQANIGAAEIVEEKLDPNTLQYVLHANARGVELPTAELKMMLRPLTKKELESESKEWMALLKKQVAESSQTNLELARLDSSIPENAEKLEALKKRQTEERKKETQLIKHTKTVLNALSDKGGDTKEQEDYIAAIQVVKNVSVNPVDHFNTAATDFRIWASSREGGGVFIQSCVRFCFILLVFALLGKLVSKLVRRILAREKRGSRMLREFIQKTTWIMVFLLGLIIALSTVGVKVGTMLTALGAGGLIIGFALQDSIANFASGMMIMIHKPFDVDDFILIDGVKGKVERMSFAATTLVTIDNKELVIPNRKAWGNTITNYTGRSVRRLDLYFRVSYSDDIERVTELLRKLAEEQELVLAKPETIVGVHRLSESAVEIFLRPWTRTEDYWPVHWELTKLAKELFDKEGITIPKISPGLMLK